MIAAYTRTERLPVSFEEGIGVDSQERDGRMLKAWGL